jgi:ABC-type transporter Mla MlaB component
MNINTLGLSFDSVNLDFGLQPTAQSTPQNMLRITTEHKKGRLILSVEGRLAGQWVGALEQCWRELLAATPRQKFSIDLCGVSYIDSAGKVLLREMHGLGGELIAEGCLNQAIVNEIVGEQEKA